MLDPKHNRLDYGEILAPPTGFTLKRAFATTYSLDLMTLLAIPVALFYAKTMEGDFSKEDRLDVLDAIHRTDEIVQVYCQKGKIQNQEKYNRLFAFLEQSVIEIMPNSATTSFHPKVWVLRYEKGRVIHYRLLVLSRNLTFDRSWDVVIQMDGVVGKTKQTRNLSLVYFIQNVCQETPLKEQAQFLNDLAKVEFDGVEGFDDFQFYPLGYAGFENPIRQHRFDNLLIVSPFVVKSKLRELVAQTRGEVWLFSRKEELDKLDWSAFEGVKAYFLNNIIVEGEEMDTAEEYETIAQKQNLHAKMYIGTIAGKNLWYVGSANCSPSAFRKNQEFLVGIQSVNYQHSPKAMLKQLLPKEGEAGIFEIYEPLEQHTMEDERLKDEQRLRKLEFGIVGLMIQGHLTQASNTDNFDLKVDIDTTTIECWEEDLTVELSVMEQPSSGKTLLRVVKQTIVFENIALPEISVFLRVHIKAPTGVERKFLLKIAINNLPANRKALIFKSLIDSQEKFLQYLRFLLAENPAEITPFLDMMGETSSNKNSSNLLGGIFSGFPIYEQLLVAASRSPEKLMAIDKLIERVRSQHDSPDAETSIIPEEFETMWQLFKTFTK